MNILALTDLRGRIDYLDRLPDVCRDAQVDLVVFAGNIVAGGARLATWEEGHTRALRLDYEQPAIQAQERADIETYSHFYRVLGQLGVPVCVIPGRLDAPERVYLQATVNRADIAPTIMPVHRGFAPVGRNFVVTGFGGYLTDGRREHMWVLEYPSWEAEFGLHFLRHLEQDRILLTHTPPAGRDLDLDAGRHVGAPAVNTLIKTVNPKFVFCGYALDGQGKALIGDSLVVHPGPLARGCYALVDTRSHEVFFGNVR